MRIMEGVLTGNQYPIMMLSGSKVHPNRKILYLLGTVHRQDNTLAPVMMKVSLTVVDIQMNGIQILTKETFMVNRKVQGNSGITETDAYIDISWLGDPFSGTPTNTEVLVRSSTGLDIADNTNLGIIVDILYPDYTE